MIALWWSYFVGLLGVLFFLLYKYSTRKFDYWKIRNVSEIKPMPFFGSLLPVLTLKTTIGEWLGSHCKKIDADYFGIYVFDQPTLIIRSPKIVKAILQKDFENFPDRTVVTNMDDPVMSHVLFFKKSPLWRPARSKVTPMFTSGKLKSMFPLILHETKQMTDYLSKYANVPNFEAKEVSAKYSTNVISRCAFAVDAGSFQNENAEFRNLTREMFGFREVIQTRKQSKHVKGADLVDILLESNSKDGEKFFTEDAMVGHAIQFFGAGFETVSSTLSFALYELAVNPHMQERLRAEIRDSFERDNGISYTAAHDMKYLDMVVCETLRKYPVLPFLDRTCRADYKVEGTDFVIEKGIPIYIPMFGLHYDTKYFPEPEKFDPERFVDKSWVNSDGMFYIPFGEGPRICIGERFGLLGVKLGLATILLKFRVEKSDKTPIPIEFEPKSFVLQSKVGIPLTFVPL